MTTTVADFPLTIRPAGQQWTGLLRRERPPEATTFRRQLGLPIDRPIVMTGHHTFFWHPGILAKYLAADAAAVAFNAVPAWLVVDQERPTSFELHSVVRRRDGRLGENLREYLGTPRSAGSPVKTRETSQPGDEQVIPSIPRGLSRIDEAMRRLPSEPPYARWQTGALVELTAPLRSFPEPPPIVYATDLSRTELFAQLVERMAKDPEGCIGAYNAAVARHPFAHVRPLIADPIQDRWELPLWHLPPDQPRRHVYAEDLLSIPIRELAPKALFMSGLMRLAGCDLFIHGTGGGAPLDPQAGREGYDFITQDWLRAWLGREIAPMTVVTATLLLPVLPGPPPSPEQLARADWLAHHARHNPDVLRDGYTADAKAKLVHRIAAAPHEECRTLFRHMHQLLDAYRANHAADLAELDSHAADAQRRLEDAAIANNRTWSFALYPDEQLAALRDRIHGAFER